MDNKLVLLIVSVLSMGSFLGVTVYIFGVYMRFVLRREKDLPYNHEPISIIIAARNELHNLQKHLPVVLNQDRDLFEVIVVDDASTDGSSNYLRKLSGEHPVLKIIHIPESSGKKQALKAGIEAAQYDLLLFTDADCQPASKRWASEMASRFTPAIEIVLGYGAYEAKPGLLNALIQTDTALIAARYAGFALWKRAYMGVGRNLAYRKSCWLRNSGFQSHSDLPYGDDDLFVGMAANKTNTALCFDPNAFTYSVAPQTFLAWVQQKKRHLHAGIRYKKSTWLLLAGESFAELLFWFSGWVLVLTGAGIWFGFLLSFYLLYKVLILGGIFKLLKIKTNSILAVALSVFLFFALFLIGINTIFVKQVSWNKK